jgi:hypothetical protein
MMAMWNYGSCYAYVAKMMTMLHARVIAIWLWFWRCGFGVVVLAMWLRRWQCGWDYCDETGDGYVTVVLAMWL